MKFIQNLCFCALALTLLVFNASCAPTKITFQNNTKILPSHSYFQEWYAGIKVGGSGYNVYLPNLNPNSSVVMDSIYFRRLKAKLYKGKSKYTAVLKKPSKHYVNLSSTYNEDKKIDKKANFPFQLKHNECVISYFENDIKKYIKITDLIEKQSKYYKEGAPYVITD